jgi:hypothetical protein
MDPLEKIEYLRLLAKFLYDDWQNTGDPETQAEIEHIAVEIIELEKHSE